MTQSIYAKHGYENRKEYLNGVSEEYGVSKQQVHALASILGPSEDFDGLITNIQDLEELK